MAKVLVFGGTGFIGKRLSNKLVTEGHEVVVFSRSVKKTNLNKDIKQIRGDISKYADVFHAFESIKPDLIFNCAAVLTRGVDEVNEKEAINTNEQGANNIINALIKLKSNLNIQAGVMLGTSMEYGVSPKILKETVPCEPMGAYAQAKYRATCYMQEKSKQYDLPLISARVFSPYGPEMNSESLVMKTFRKALNNEKITLSDKQVTRDFIYIDDLIDLLIQMTKVANNHSGEIFNCGSGKAVTLEELVNMIVFETKSKSHIIWDFSLKSPYDLRRWEADMSKTKKVLGWKPKTFLKQGLHSIFVSMSKRT